jgi:hypothetical protein
MEATTIPILIFQDLDGCLCDLDRATREFYNGGFRETPLYKNNKDSYPDTEFQLISELEDLIGREQVTSFLLVTPEEFWGDISWMSDGKELWESVEPTNPIILSAPVMTEACKAGKRRWCAENLGDYRVILENDKYKHVTDNLLVEDNEIHYLRVLVDDSKRKTAAWTGAGGISIRHLNTKTTKEDLWALGILEDF